MKISQSTIYPALTSFSVFPFLPLLQLLEWLSRYMCGYNFTMNSPPGFHSYTGLNGLVNSFSQFTITPRNKLIFGPKPHWSAKMRKQKTTKNNSNNNMQEKVARRCSTKKLSQKLNKNRREIPVLQERKTDKSTNTTSKIQFTTFHHINYEQKNTLHFHTD